MPIYKKPEEKAGETVTIRLTLDERRMLDYLSAVDNQTLTDFIRRLIAKRAQELNIVEPPPPKIKRRPGRPKMHKPLPQEVLETNEPPLLRISTQSNDDALTDSATEDSTHSAFLDTSRETAKPTAPQVPANSRDDANLSKTPSESVPIFSDLVDRFRSSFVHRADGTKKELEDTIQFLCRKPPTGEPIISSDMPISELTSERLVEIRQNIRETDARLAKKNLYLTYLRMMLHFGVKEPDWELRINPSRELPPLSIVESDDRRRFFTGVSE